MIGVFSCERDEFIDEGIAQENEIEVQASTINYDNIGTKVVHPYNVNNMKRAWDAISNGKTYRSSKFAKGDGSEVFEIKTSHLYIKFMPKNSVKEGLLKQDSTIVFFEYPLDREFTDEELNSRVFTAADSIPTYWASVPVDKLSNIPMGDVHYEILDSLYLPEEDSYFDDETDTTGKGTNVGTKKGVINTKEDFYRHLMVQAHKQSGSLASAGIPEDPKTGWWVFGHRWYPSGTIQTYVRDRRVTERVQIGTRVHTTYDYSCQPNPRPVRSGGSSGSSTSTTPPPRGGGIAMRSSGCPRIIETRVPIYGNRDRSESGFIGLNGAKVVVRQGFTVRSAITNINGSFSMGRVSGRGNYLLIWERHDWVIRDGAYNRAEIRGPTGTFYAWNHDIRGDKHEYFALVHNAAHHYFHEDIKGLRRPPRNDNGILDRKIRFKTVYIGGSGDSGEHRQRGGGLFNNRSSVIELSISNPGHPQEAPYYTAIHELAHSSHWSMNGGIYDDECRVAESWAVGVGVELTNMKYFYTRSSSDYIRRSYTGVVVDLIDGIKSITTSNTRSNLNNCYNASGAASRTSSYQDRLSGYTIRQIEDALQGQATWDGWKTRLKQLYNNPTERYVDEAFRYWTSY